MGAQAPAVVIRALVPDDALLRAILKRRYLEDLAGAFLLRANERDTGLSVMFDCSYADCRAPFDPSFGIASLTVRSVRELNLEVVPDAPTHANITGVPHKEDDPARAEFLASRLAERATIVDRGRQP